jgi:hypothetical protein
MGIGHPSRNRENLSLGGNVVSLQHPADEFFDLLSPLLEEATAVTDDEPLRQELHNVVSLSEENARLRALAVELSNLLGDLPVREWEVAARHDRNKA